MTTTPAASASCSAPTTQIAASRTATTTSPSSATDKIIINGNTSNATLQTVDMLGRVVNTQQVNGNTAQMAPVANGVYVLRLIDGTDMKSQKIVVR